MLRRLLAASTVLGLLLVPRAHAQSIPAPDQLVRVAAAPATVKAGATATIPVTLTIAPGWHINANPAAPDYMVATVVELTSAAGLSGGAPKYPAAKPIKLGFEDSEVHVWDGAITVELSVHATSAALNGTQKLRGKVRFQACNDQLCLAPVSVPFTIAVEVSGGVARTSATSTADTAAAPEIAGVVRDTASSADSAHAGAAPLGGSGDGAAPGLSTFASRSARAAQDSGLAKGGFGAFVLLFLIGLGLNLTPCVYPMLGVTVALFGTRRAAPPLQVFGLALVYVLGMASMYSALGVFAALTGSLFGAVMQNPIVSIAIGLLLVGLSLSMFGVYEIQLPAAIRERAAAVQATNVVGIFLAGLLVGVFAAPCIAAPIVGVLAVVTEKGDPWFGFQTFFTLAMGLGAPYLVLGTFSNLLQKLPRSGDWMEWVKKVFGVIMIALAARFVMLGLNPDLVPWVVPVALVAGGAWLGWIDRSADRRPRFRAFKRVAGTLAVIGGLAMVASAPRNHLPMSTFSAAALDSVRARGEVAMVDFSADWCVPCHELERYTLSDYRVIQRARGFAAFKADLTHDTAESQEWSRRFGITGVPTVLFIGPDGREVPGVRVEGFLPAEEFLRRMKVAAQAGQRASEVR